MVRERDGDLSMIIRPFNDDVNFKANKVISSYEKFERLIPDDIKNDSIAMADMIIKQSDLDSDKVLSKSSMKANMGRIAYSMKVKASTIDVKEDQYYLPIDAAYKIYLEMMRNKIPHAWLIANMLVIKWTYTMIRNEPLSGLKIEQETDLVLRSPTYYLIKTIILALLRFIPTVVGSFLLKPIVGSTVSYGFLAVYISFTLLYLFKFYWKSRNAKSDKTTKSLTSVASVI